MAYPYQFVQSAKGTATGVSSVSATFKVPATPGNAIIAISLADAMDGTGSFTDDNAGDLYWNVINFSGLGGKPGAQMQYVTVQPDGASTVTFANHAGILANLTLIVLEYTTPAVYRKGNISVRTSQAVGVNTGPILTKAPDDLVVAFAVDFSSAVETWQQSSTFTMRETGNNGGATGMAVADFIAEDIGNYSCSFAGAGYQDSLLAGIAAFGLIILIISCNSPGPGTVGVPFTQTFTAVNGTPPYTFSISAGVLPPGLSLNGATGVVSGTPTTPGTYDFTVSAVDSSIPFPLNGFSACEILINAVTVSIPVPIGGGNPVAKGGCRPFNHYDWCLLQEIAKLRKIKPLPPCSVPPEFWNTLPWESDFGSIPGLAVPFRKISSILTPTTAAGDTVVDQLIVPQGYDGILTGFYWRYNGLNFVEGSGDILWRIQINMRFVKDLSNVGFTIGSPATPMPMVEGGQLLQSRQRVSVIVNVPNLSGTIQIGTATITGALFGFFWPKGVPGWTSR